MDIHVPKGLFEDHKKMLAELDQVLKAGGKTGAAASSLMHTLKPHIEREEQYALPPLGLLPILTQDEGELDYEMAKAVAMTITLHDEMPHLLAEHKAILAGVAQLSAAAKQEGKVETKQLCDRLKLHVEEEEEVYYPAALLVGQYLTIKMPMVVYSSIP